MARTNDEIESAFAGTCRLLDRLLDDARPRLVAAGVTITDRSNRSCFDKSGYPYCLWLHRFDRQFRHDSEIAVASAELSFFEPIDPVGRELVALSIAEIYQVGKRSRVNDRTERRIAASDIDGIDLGSLVEELIAASSERLLLHGVRTEAG
jgi:hypothetical protein